MTPPTPNPAFAWTTEPWGPALRSSALGRVAQHVFTSRQLRLAADAQATDAQATDARIKTDAQIGNPSNPTNPTNLSNQPAPWASAAASVGVTADRVMRVTQVHGCAVRVLARGQVPDGASADRPDADALVSDAPGLALAVMTADCVPVLLADPITGAAGAVHAGWRGVAGRVLWAAIKAMQDHFGAEPADLVAAVGPSIRACCYEVGEELMAEFQKAGESARNTDRWFSRVEGAPPGKFRLDLPGAVRDQLIWAGLRPGHIGGSGLCTRCHPEVFDSYRRDGAAAGRMAALVRVP
ncbi:MAG: peptidoglycan editing factor PgeF [Vicinamibacterales bacterium]